ncbi:MAG: hypothetical protein QOH91_731 [Mycobacterium sp.]|nr:hypothetical protein [Mycobacterium sp.]
MKTVQATVAAAVWTAAVTMTVAFAGPVHADPEIGPCDIQQLAVAASSSQPGMGHRAVQLNFTLQPDITPCQLSGYPTVDAEVLAPGAAPVHAEQTPNGYLGGATPGTTVTLAPGHGAHAMVEWVAAGNSTCAIYGPDSTDIRLRVIPPGMWQTFDVPISVGRNEGLCNLQVHPLVAD